MPLCNGADRGSNFALTRKGADFRCGAVLASPCLRFIEGKLVRDHDDHGSEPFVSAIRRIHDVMLAKVLGVGKAAVSTTPNAVRERSAVKVARSVLRGPRFREETRLPSRTGSSGDQAPDPTDAWVQEISLCLHPVGRHRNHAHDRQGAIERWRRWSNSRTAILFAGWIRKPYHIGLGQPLALTATEPLKDLFIRLPHAQTADDYEALLPWKLYASADKSSKCEAPLISDHQGNLDPCV
ncbi:hypothetical protein QF000_008018 [Paraburkholderia atlantica]